MPWPKSLAPKKSGFKLRLGAPFSWTASLKRGGVHGISVSSSGLAVACYDGNVRLFDAQGQPLYKLLLVKGRSGLPYYLAHSPDGALLAVTCSQTLFVVEVSTGAVLAHHGIVTGDVSSSFCWSPDGQSLLWLTDSALHRWTWSPSPEISSTAERTELTDRRWYAPRRWPRIVGDKVFFGAANTHGENGVICFDWQSGVHLNTLRLQDGGQAMVPRLQEHPKGIVAWQPGSAPLFWSGGGEAPQRALEQVRGLGQCFPEGLLSREQIDRGWQYAFVLNRMNGERVELFRAEYTSLPWQQGPEAWVARSAPVEEKPHGHVLERITLS